LRFGLNVQANSTQYDNSVHAGLGFRAHLLSHPLPLCDRSSTIFVNQQTQQRRSDSSLFVFVIRKTLNQRSLWYRDRTHRLEAALHGTAVQTILVFNCDCCRRPLVHLKS